MIYITGDIHGDLSRFKDRRLKKLKKTDYLIVCGDFGFLWDGSKKEQKILKKLGSKKYTILFVEGCHENYNLLYAYQPQPWKGGEVRVLSGKLRQLIRGGVFEIDDKKVFAFGGGQGSDHDIRKQVKTCWKEELPTEEELIEGIKNLKDSDNTVDYIVTHEPPAMLRDYLDVDPELLQTNQLNASFNMIADSCKFKRWFFGKCHRNKVVSPRFQAVFSDVVKAE